MRRVAELLSSMGVPFAPLIAYDGKPIEYGARRRGRDGSHEAVWLVAEGEIPP